jgi:hypothetical protein
VNLVPNARIVITRSAAIWIAFLFAAMGLLIHSLPSAPLFIRNSLPVENIVAGWDWLSGSLTAIGVLLGRVIQQDSISPP